MWRKYFSLRLALLLGLGAAANAHEVSTAYSRVDATRDETWFIFLFDVLTLGRMAPVDANADRRVTVAELTAAYPAIETFLRSHILVGINGQPADLGRMDEPAWSKPADGILSETDVGQRLIRFTFRRPALNPTESVGLHFGRLFAALDEKFAILGRFTSGDRVGEGVFSRTEPYIVYETGHRVPWTQQVAQYLKLGIGHIFLGYDHICFLLALLFVPRFIDLLKIITAFTVAHTITLSLAVLHVVNLPPRLIETGIALSIVYVAAENLRVHQPRHRWRLTFCFGLLHGFGFANVLGELGLPSGGIARALLSFNLGVEIGQALIVAVLWPVLLGIGHQSWAPKFKIVLSAAVLAVGLGWTVERGFGLGFIPW